MFYMIAGSGVNMTLLSMLLRVQAEELEEKLDCINKLVNFKKMLENARATKNILARHKIWVSFKHISICDW